jgi:hypothetical protein
MIDQAAPPVCRSAWRSETVAAPPLTPRWMHRLAMSPFPRDGCAMTKPALLTLLCSLTTACGLFIEPPGGTKDRDDTSASDGDDTGDPGDDSDPPDWTWTPVLIDFDELSGEIDVGTTYPEVTFSTDDDSRFYSWNYPSYARSEPYTAYTANSPGGAGVRADLTFTFTEPVRALEFWTLGDQTNGRYAWVDVVTEQGETGSVALVGDGGSSTAERCDLSAWEHITSITIRDVEDSYTVNIDDISFELRGL